MYIYWQIAYIDLSKWQVQVYAPIYETYKVVTMWKGKGEKKFSWTDTVMVESKKIRRVKRNLLRALKDMGLIGSLQ